ncbi:MAG TPA: hypothetical protein VK157_08805 [Phycisphaerales bacterium]|nr:hypothetical protein [Phycisphaerales bacterium]
MRTTLLAAIVFATSCQLALAQSPPAAAVPDAPQTWQQFEKLLKSHEAKIEAAQQAILLELEKFDRTSLPENDWSRMWAGRYLVGDGLGKNVHICIGPSGDVAYQWYGCMGLYDGNYGKIIERLPDGVRVKWEIDPTLSTYRQVSERMYFVMQGEDRFVISTDQLLDLVNAFNEGGFRREKLPAARLREFADWSLRRDVVRDRNAPPTLPAPYDKYVLREPTEWTIESMDIGSTETVTGEVKSLTASARIKGGSDQGAFVGMELRWRNERFDSGTFTITKAEPGSCTAEFRSFFTRQGALPRVGEVIRLPGLTDVPQPLWPQPDPGEVVKEQFPAKPLPETISPR